MSKQLLTNATVITMNPTRDQYSKGAVLIEDDRIIAIGTAADLTAPDAEVIDLAGKIVLPGFVNTHVHTSQQLGRGLGDDVPLLVWLRERIWPYESNLTEADSEISTLLFGLEQIRSGVTTVGESGGQHVPGMVRAIKQLGLRAVLSRSTMDEGEGLPIPWQNDTDHEINTQIELYERCNDAADGRVRIWFSLRTLFNNSDDLITRTRDIAQQYNTGVMMHIAEIREENDYALATRGATTATHLHNLGLLNSNLLAAHCVWLTDEEMALFREHDVKVTHNPAAAMRVLGFAKIPEMVDQGICVSIGTDGAPSNNRMTMVDEIWLTSLIHKGRTLDPTTLPAETILDMATMGGAKCLLWDDDIGSLEAGKKADLIVVNPNTANMLPVHDPIANLVTSMNNTNIESTMVDGQWLMRDGKVLVVDEEAVYERAKQHAQEVVERGGIQLPDRFNVIDK